MFNKNILPVVFVTTVILSGCGKKLLNKAPLGVSTEENSYNTADNINSALNAAYDPLGWEGDRRGAIYSNPWFFGDVVSDDSRKGGGSESDIANFHAFETFTGNAGMPEILLPWQHNYTGIYRSNLVIKNTPNANVSSSVKDRAVGEAKFLRAYYHFTLVKMYGDVPLITEVLNPEQYTLSRSPKALVYAQIEKDLNEAAAVLAPKGAFIGHADKGAALSLLAKVQMFQTRENPAKWAEVKETVRSVVALGNYSLHINYADVFTLTTENGVESIFEIQNMSNSAGAAGDNNSNWGNGNEGTFMNVMFRGRANGGWGFNTPTKDLLEEFKKEKTKDGKDDPRLKATIVQNGDSVFGKPYVSDDVTYPYTGLYTRKYIESETIVNLNQSDGPSNPRIIRYADVLLMGAEAENEAGSPVEALKYLKQVRDRVNMPEITETDKTNLRAIIWRERRVELAMEGHRFFDIVRQGRAAQVMKATIEGKLFREGVNEVFPIPQSEIDLSRGQISQNPGLN